jgi:feruloyl-CoA synthase
VTPGYLGRDDLTKKAFDEEGFYSLGDAAKFIDDNDPEKGLVFDGRVTEDFKLDSGTWVSVGTLRAQAVAAASPAVFDCVVCGQDKPFIGLLLWPNAQAVLEMTGKPKIEDALADPKLGEFLRERFAAHNKSQPGTSSRIRRVLLMAEPPSVDGHEITDKGYVNQRATLERRNALVEKLYAGGPEVIEIP